MAQSGCNSITVYTYMREPDIFPETGTKDSMFNLQKRQNKNVSLTQYF